MNFAKKMGKLKIVFVFSIIFMLVLSSAADAKGSVSSGRSSVGGSSSRSSSSYSGSRSSTSSSSKSSNVRSAPGSYSGSSNSTANKYSGSKSSTTTPSSGSGGATSKASTSTGAGYGGSTTSKQGAGTSGGSNTGNTTSSGGASAAKTSTAQQGQSRSTTGTESKKISYMQDVYKKQTSNSNYTTYKQKLDADQQKAYDSSMNQTYQVPNRMNLEDSLATRQQRMGRFDSYPVRTGINISIFPGNFGYGSAFIGPFDLWFITRASDLFWYNHWDLIYPYRSYFDPVAFAAREMAIHQMEMQHLSRDSAYMDPDWDYDLAYSPEYQQNHMDSLYQTKKVFHSFWGSFFSFMFLLGIGLLILFAVRRISRKRNNMSSNQYGGGGIY